jgi:hypothetical protein
VKNRLRTEVQNWGFKLSAHHRAEFGGWLIGWE